MHASLEHQEQENNGFKNQIKRKKKTSNGSAAIEQLFQEVQESRGTAVNLKGDE